MPPRKANKREGQEVSRELTDHDMGLGEGEEIWDGADNGQAGRIKDVARLEKYLRSVRAEYPGMLGRSSMEQAIEVLRSSQITYSSIGKYVRGEKKATAPFTEAQANLLHRRIKKKLTLPFLHILLEKYQEKGGDLAYMKKEEPQEVGGETHDSIQDFPMQQAEQSFPQASMIVGNEFQEMERDLLYIFPDFPAPQFDQSVQQASLIIKSEVQEISSTVVESESENSQIEIIKSEVQEMSSTVVESKSENSQVEIIKSKVLEMSSTVVESESENSRTECSACLQNLMDDDNWKCVRCKEYRHLYCDRAQEMGGGDPTADEVCTPCWATVARAGGSKVEAHEITEAEVAQTFEATEGQEEQEQEEEQGEEQEQEEEQGEEQEQEEQGEQNGTEGKAAGKKRKAENRGADNMVRRPAARVKPKVARNGLHCNECKRTFRSQQGLATHISFCKDPGHTRSCNQCDYTAGRRGYLRQHIESLHSGPLITCDSCDFTSHSRKRLQLHQSAHQRGTNICDVCRVNYGSKKDLKRHKSTQHQKKDG